MIRILLVAITFNTVACLSQLNAEHVEDLQAKTDLMLSDLKKQRDLEVLQLMHDAMKVLDGRQDLESYQKAQAMLAFAFKLDPENKRIPFVSHYIQLKRNRIKQRSDEKVRLALKQIVPIDFEENTLESVLDYLRLTTDQNFYINWSRLLNDAGVERDVPINMRLRRVPVDVVLDLILDQVGQLTGELKPIGWEIKHGILTISTKADLARKENVKDRPALTDIRQWVLKTKDAQQAVELRKKTEQMFSDLGKRRDQEVLQLMHDAMKIQQAHDGQPYLAGYLKAQSMLVYADQLDPGNEKVDFIHHLNQVKINWLKKQPDAHVWMALKKVVSVDFEDNRFGNVIDYLQKQTGLNFYINWPVLLGSSGIERDVPISLRLRNIPVEKVLDLVLQQVNALSGEINKSIWRVNEGIVIIEIPKPEPRHRKRVPR